MDPPRSPRSEEGPDAELSNLVESLQKIQAAKAAPPRSKPETVDYVSGELENLKRKQAMIQEQMDTKTREIATLRETLLVVNGAVQGLQHIHKYLTEGGAEASFGAAPAADAAPSSSQKK